MDPQSADPEGVAPPPDTEVVVRWRARSVHHRALLLVTWASAAGAAFVRPLGTPERAVWVAAVTVAFAFLVLTRWRTEARAEVTLTATHVYARYRSGHVDAYALADLRGAERLTRPDARWVFDFGGGAKLSLPDETDARNLVEALRTCVPPR